MTSRVVLLTADTVNLTKRERVPWADIKAVEIRAVETDADL
jgi:hypothetical protein